MLAGQIAMCILDRCFNGLITNLHLVVILIALSQTLQNSNAVGHSRFFNSDLGKTPRQSSVFFDMLLVLFLRRSTNCPQGSPSQSRFQDIGRIQGRINPAARAHDGMQLIDKEDDMAVFFDVIDDIVHPLFKVSAETSPSNDIHQV